MLEKHIHLTERGNENLNRRLKFRLLQTLKRIALVSSYSRKTNSMAENHLKRATGLLSITDRMILAGYKKAGIPLRRMIKGVPSDFR
jgi:hypothetical protein